VVQIQENNHGRRERRALASREVEPAQLGLAGAAQIGSLTRQLGKEAKTEIEYLVTSRAAADLPIESFLNLDREYWGVESGLHQRLDCSAFEDRMRVHHKGVIHILGLFSRIGVALFIPWAQERAVVRERTYPWWREWNAGHRWHIIRQVTQPP
jgi:hypothetical protein